MYAIEKGMVQVNGEKFPVFSRNIDTEDGGIEVAAGTTGFKGGDRKSGGRAYVSIEGTNLDMYLRPTTDEDGNNTGFVMAVCGDDELDALIQALYFAKKALYEGAME